MKVLAMRADGGGCAFYRIQEPARVVSALDSGVDVRVSTWLNVDAEQDSKTGLVKVREILEDVDLIILQRPTTQGIYAVAEQAKRQGIPFIVELDDDLELVPEHNRAWRAVQPHLSPLENYEWLKKTALLADGLTVSTPALQRYKPRGPSFVIPNMVPERIFLVRGGTRERVNIGWTGTLQTHPDDLQAVGGQVGKAALKYDADVVVVGDGAGVRKALKLPNAVKLAATGWVPLDDYYQAIADNIDVGIVPLKRDPFNNAKSALKLLELSALGIPTVASAMPDNRRLHSYGVGVLAHKSPDFGDALKRWLVSDAERRADGARYRAVIRENFTYERNAHLWLNAWEQVADRGKKK